MTFLENEQFLADLAKLFQKGRSSGVVVITMKRYDGRTKPKSRVDKVHPHQPVEYKCLFRAKIGKKKISTVLRLAEHRDAVRNNHPEHSDFVSHALVNGHYFESRSIKILDKIKLSVSEAAHISASKLKVTAKEVNKFQLAYANVLKAGMDGLKKRDRRALKEKRSAPLRN